MTDRDMTAAIKALATETGFARVGIAPAEPLAADVMRRWLDRGFHGQMDYLARNFSKRCNPAELVDGTRSIICLAMPYVSPAAAGELTVAAYAQGRDYHAALKTMCLNFMDRLSLFCRARGLEAFSGRAFVDSAPVMEHTLAARAGIGWIGRNGCLTVEGLGSYVLLAEVFCNLSLTPDEPIPDQCGDCGRCREACPTRAFVGDKLIDARRCVSYLTIEHEGDIEPSLRAAIGNRVLGCDECQRACPHNQGLAPQPNALGDATIAARCGALTLQAVLRWSRDDWDAFTRGTAMRRCGYEAFLRNAVICAGNSGRRDLAGALAAIKQSCPALQALVEWALGRLSD